MTDAEKFADLMANITFTVKQKFGLRCETIFFEDGHCGVDNEQGQCEIDFKDFTELYDWYIENK